MIIERIQPSEGSRLLYKLNQLPLPEKSQLKEILRKKHLVKFECIEYSTFILDYNYEESYIIVPVKRKY